MSIATGGTSMDNGVKRWFPTAAIVLSVVLAWHLLADAGFFADDFINLDQDHGFGLSERLFAHSVFGHFIPGFNLGNYLVSLHRPWNWSFVILAVLFFYVGTLVFFNLSLQQLSVSWFARSLIVLALGTSIPIMLDTPWWATALEYHVALFGASAALYCHLRYLERRRIFWTIPASLAMALAVSCLESALVLPIFLLLVSAFFYPQARGLRNACREIVVFWPAWIIYALPLALDLWWRFSHASLYQTPPLPTVHQLLQFLWLLTVRTGFPLLAGLDTWNFNATAQLAAEIACPLVLVGLLWWARRQGVAIGRFLFIVAVPYVITSLMVGLTRVEPLGVSVASDPKYLTLPFFLLIVAGVFAWRARGTNPTTRSPSSISTLQHFGVVGGVALVATFSLLQAPVILSMNTVAQHYATTFIASWNKVSRTNPRAFVWDVQVSYELINPEFYPFNTISSTLAMEYSHVRVNADSTGGYVLSSNGSLVPAKLVTIATSKPQALSCQDVAKGTTDLSIALEEKVLDVPWFGILSYTSTRPSTLLVQGEAGNTFPLPSGTHTVVVDFPDNPVRVARAIVRTKGSFCVGGFHGIVALAPTTGA